MAPEVLSKGTAYDSSADWFSFGCMLYKLLKGYVSTPQCPQCAPPPVHHPVTHDNRPQFLPRLARFVSQKLDNVVVLIDGAVVVFLRAGSGVTSRVRTGGRVVVLSSFPTCAACRGTGVIAGVACGGATAPSRCAMSHDCGRASHHCSARKSRRLYAAYNSTLTS